MTARITRMMAALLIGLLLALSRLMETVTRWAIRQGLPYAIPAGAATMQRLSEHAAFTLIETTDVGGTTAATGWVSMKNFARAMAYVEIGTWNATDDLDHCRIEQATNSSGGSSKELTTDASGGDYDTDNPVDADGDFVIIEIRAEDLDADSNFNHIRLVVGEDGNSGVDNVTALLIRYGYAYPQKELNGAATTGSKVYVQP